MPMQPECDVAVIGGGLVGVAIACGLRLAGVNTVLLDEGDAAIRASRGNFGLVWVQGKGDLLAPYTPWAREAGRVWPELARWLKEFTGLDVGLEQPGGVFLCMTEDDLAARAAQMARVAEQSAEPYEYEMVDSRRLRELVPQVGPKVAGASYSAYDGQANPIRLFRALHRAFVQLGGRYAPNAGVTAIERRSSAYRLKTADGEWTANRIVLASGLGNVGLGEQLGISIPVKPMRGQIMVTERLPQLFPLVMEQIRQTDDGTLLIGTSWEDVGFDLSTSYGTTRRIARNALDFVPMLRSVSVVRSWAALRILTPDASPIYDEIAPGAFLVTCHSGVSLAGNHVFATARWIADGRIPQNMRAFSRARFEPNHQERVA
ncbi:FAD-binding oxidoreductase [Ancylobacter sp. Lp-2]|uniref:NAD(P)/FAD-dependent oxidoreductase n=1 Tax=Ancylobacter sp. Lp-2 TaxID=2881339 RepID=UPI001E28A396|nr:FAD-dependent oxidoreductase [Ancylobacter sp. Lp-2]MCB4771028.1 FAD-binding oxidoreductase [Ancylobacter sp. Lp-2]